MSTPATKYRQYRPPAVEANIANTALLFDSVSGKFTYLSNHGLRELSRKKLLWSVNVGVGKESIKWGAWNVSLPPEVVQERLLGWWEECWIVDGVEDVRWVKSEPVTEAE